MQSIGKFAVCFLISLAFAIGGATEAGASVQSASDPIQSREGAFEVQYDRGAEVAQQFTDAVGIGISPMGGMGALGALGWLRTESGSRHLLPFHQQPWFWGPCLAILFFGIAASILSQPIPALVKAYSAWKPMENKIAAFLALPTVGYMTLSLLQSGLASQPPPTTAAGAAGTTILASASSMSIDILTSVAFMASTFVVLVLKNAIDVLILLCPIPSVDTCIRALKLIPLSILVLASVGSPWIGAVAALFMLILATLAFAWAMRLSIMGSVFSRDVLLRRWRRTPNPARGFQAFARRGMPGVAVRTYGRVLRTDGAVVFRCRRFFIGPRRDVPVPAGDLIVVRGLLFGPDVDVRDPRTQESAGVLWCAPAIRYHEELLARELGAVAIADGVLLRGIRAAWRWIVDLFRGRAPVVVAGDVGGESVAEV